MRGSKGNGHGNDGKLKPQSMVTDYYGDDIQLELTTYPLIIRICWQIYNYYQKLARILKIIIRLRSQVVTSNEYMHPKRRFWTEHFIQNEHLKDYFTRCSLIHSICLRLVSVVVQCSLIGVSRLSFSHFRVFHTA